MTNDPGGFAGRIERWFVENQEKERRNASIIGATIVGGVALMSWTLAPAHVENILSTLQDAVRSLPEIVGSLGR